MNERWKQISQFPKYEASDAGRVRRIGSEKPLKPQPQTSGYMTVALSGKRPLIHRLVWEAFNGPIPDGMQINHRDCDKTRNHLGNLELTTPKENIRHAIRNGHPIGGGERHPRAKLTDEQVEEIRSRYTGRYGEQVTLAREYGISAYTINAIVNNRHRPTGRGVDLESDDLDKAA